MNTLSTTSCITSLINTVTNLVNDWSYDGKATDQTKPPKAQRYWMGLERSLKSAGFVVLGAGFFSVVLRHVDLHEKVLKVGLKKEDSAAAYTAWCRINQGRVGVPAVYETKRTAGCYVVVLDELFPIDTDNLKEWRGFRAAAAGVHGREWSNDAKCPHLEALHATAVSIRDFFKGLASFDLHDDNVMVDRQGNVVITDPVSYSEGVASGTSWCLMDDSNGINEIKRQAIAKRAKERHERNQKRQEKRREQKARLKLIKARQGVRGNDLSWVITDALALACKRPEARNLTSILRDLKPALMQPHFIDPEVIKQINGLDHELDAQFLRG